MKTIVLISECIKKEKNPFCYSFHFKGVLKGENIHLVKGLYKKDALKVGIEYIIYLEIMNYKSGVLLGRIIRYKSIEYLNWV